MYCIPSLTCRARGLFLDRIHCFEKAKTRLVRRCIGYHVCSIPTLFLPCQGHWTRSRTLGNPTQAPLPLPLRFSATALSLSQHLCRPESLVRPHFSPITLVTTTRHAQNQLATMKFEATVALLSLLASIPQSSGYSLRTKLTVSLPLLCIDPCHRW